MHNQASPAKRAYAAQMLFGRAGRQMVKVLAEGSGEIRKQGAELDDYRLISEAEAGRPSNTSTSSFVSSRRSVGCETPSRPA